MLARTGLARRVPSRFSVNTRLATGSGNASRPGSGGNGIPASGCGDGFRPSSAIGSLVAGCPSSRQSSADNATSAIIGGEDVADRNDVATIQLDRVKKVGRKRRQARQREPVV